MEAATLMEAATVKHHKEFSLLFLCSRSTIMQTRIRELIFKLALLRHLFLLLAKLTFFPTVLNRVSLVWLYSWAFVDNFCWHKYLSDGSLSFT